MTTDFSCFVSEANTTNTLYLQIDGMHCAACAWRIESTLNALPHVKARVNFSTQRLAIEWQGDKAQANDFALRIEQLGFTAAPFDAATLAAHNTDDENFLLRCLAVSGFASGNIMLFSLALWFSSHEELMGATRDLMHWIMAFISLPTIIYAGRPFFYSAWTALKTYHTNMDVPISLAIVLAALMSLHETIVHGPYVYFDSSVMLIFFLLVGRYLDKKARGRARDAAQGLLAMMGGTATVLENNQQSSIAIRDIRQDMVLLIAAGEKVPADSIVLSGASDIDGSLVTGETLPQAVHEGTRIYAGMINLSAPLTVRVLAANDKSMLAEIVALMERAEQTQGKYVRLADRIAGWYTPVVHILAAVTFGGWWLAGAPWQEALMNATAVLIITCPCALGLAIPIVQVVASSRLFKRGILLKSGNALEKLTHIDTVMFDKTGTLTLGMPVLQNATAVNQAQLQLAASMAAHSKHPLSRAVAAAWQGTLIPLTVTEIPAHGLETTYEGHTVRLGRRGWCGSETAAQDSGLELWLNDGSRSPVRFVFTDTLRDDAKDVVATLHQQGIRTALLSGDRRAVVEDIATQLGIETWHAEISPLQKTEIIEAAQKNGQHILMVGDGLNDAAALAAAHVSMSPSSGVDITQNAADLVFQGKHLAPVLDARATALHAGHLVRQNLGLSLAYNLIAVPIAVAGHTTPLIAAIAMSSSSLLVVLNALRLKRPFSERSVTAA